MWPNTQMPSLLERMCIRTSDERMRPRTLCVLENRRFFGSLSVTCGLRKAAVVMKRVIKGGLTRVSSWYRGLSLRGKIVLLVCLVGLFPMGIMLALSMMEMQHHSEELLLSALNQGYHQMEQAIKDKMNGVHNISTLLAVSDVVNSGLLTDEEKSIAKQLADFGNIDSYAYSMEMAFEASNVLFYIDESYPVVNDYGGRFRSINMARQMDWHQNLESNNGRATWVSFQEDVMAREQVYVAITRTLWSMDDYSKEIGIMAVCLERKHLENLLLSSVQQQIIYIETSYGQILASNLPEESIIRLPDIERARNYDSFQETDIDGEKYLVRSALIDDSSTYLVSLVPMDEIEAQTKEASISTGGVVSDDMCLYAVAFYSHHEIRDWRLADFKRSDDTDKEWSH